MSVLGPPRGADRLSPRERVERRAYRLYKRVRRSLSQGLPRTHVFIAGVQRSGTNMLMEVLEWNPFTDVYHETDERAFDTYEMRDPDVIHALARSSNAPFFVVKSLCELDRIGAFLKDFEPAKVVWIVRDYHDSSNSAVRSFPNFVPQLKRLARNKDSDGWRGRGMSDATQAMLRHIAELNPSESDGAAMMWYYRNVLFFEQSLNQDHRVALLRYEDWVRDPAAKLRGLCRFLGLPACGPWMTRYIHGASVRKAEPPALLGDVESACADLMVQFNALPHL